MTIIIFWNALFLIGRSSIFILQDKKKTITLLPNNFPVKIIATVMLLWKWSRSQRYEKKKKIIIRSRWNILMRLCKKILRINHENIHACRSNFPIYQQDQRTSFRSRDFLSRDFKVKMIIYALFFIMSATYSHNVTWFYSNYAINLF